MKTRYRSWNFAVPVTITLSVIGLLSGTTEFFVATVIPLLIILISSFARQPERESLEITRKITQEAPAPGEEVEIDLIFKNNGKKTMNDVRIVDSVPDGLKVSDGSPRTSLALTPGSEKKISYNVVVRRGTHVFDDVKVEFRGSGPFGEGCEIEASGDSKIVCSTELGEAFLRDETEKQTGNLVTTEPGDGVEFHSLRDYKSSDPVSRVEWKHLAKTGELATKNFREEKSSQIIILVDARKVSDRKALKGHPTGIDLSCYGAQIMFETLVKSNHRPGLAILGVERDDIDSFEKSSSMPFISPGTSREKMQRVKKALRESIKADKKEASEISSIIYEILPPNAQVIIFSPLLDDELNSTVKLLEKQNFPTTVVSPDITYSETGKARHEKIKRDLRIKALRKWTPVIDWDIKSPISIQVSKALKRIYKRDL